MLKCKPNINLAEGLALDLDDAKKLVARYRFSEVFGLKPNPSVDIQLIRSLLVSCIALAVDFTTLITLKEVFGLYYLAAVAVGALAGLATNYYLSITWVFSHRKLRSMTFEFAIFAAINFAGLMFNLAIIYYLVETHQLDYRWAKVVATIVVFFWNFIARKKILF